MILRQLSCLHLSPADNTRTNQLQIRRELLERVTRACSHSNCSTQKFIISWELKKHFVSITAGGVYCLSCKRSNQQYDGANELADLL